MNVMFIMSDTLRKDHLGCYGNPDIVTPHLDAFAATCAKFENYIAGSFPTMPTRADIFTAKPSFTGLGWAPLLPEEKILPKILQEAGYTTAAVVDTPFVIRGGYNYDLGFKDFEWIRGQLSYEERPKIVSERRYEEDCFAPRTSISAERCLEYYHKDKFFLYVDMWDPHEPWDAPAWYTRLYYPEYQGELIRSPYWDWRESGMTEEELEIGHACYCGEVTMVDRWVGRLLEKLRYMGLLEDTIVVFVSDHGYYFGEHGQLGKCRIQKGQWHRSPLYGEITRIPLLFYVPGLEPRTTTAMVSPIDLMPTLLELLGLEVPQGIQGRSFVSVLRGETEDFRDYCVTSLPLSRPGAKTKIVDNVTRSIEALQVSTVTTDKWTLLCGMSDSPAELYDLENDPEESRNVISENRAEAERLHGKYVEFLEEAGTAEDLLAPRRELSRL